MLPLLLHHANRTCKSTEFYAIKDKILGKHGVTIGYDVQHIEGKRCHACGGSGVWYSEWSDFADVCNRCYSGWYKRPMWVLLSRKKYGRYIFHKPIERKYGLKNPYFEIPGAKRIDGYVDHRYSRYGYLAVLILFLIYNRQAAKEYFHDMGLGFRTQWWRPMNWLYVVAHFSRYGWNAYPLRPVRSYLNKVRASYEEGVHARNQVVGDDDLPF